MSPENFAYWLQGFVELTQGQTPNPAQWKSIQEHLCEVFKKVTPPVGEVKRASGILPGQIDWDELYKKLSPDWCTGQTVGISPDPKIVTIC